MARAANQIPGFGASRGLAVLINRSECRINFGATECVAGDECSGESCHRLLCLSDHGQERRNDGVEYLELSAPDSLEVDPGYVETCLRHWPVRSA